MGNPDFQPCGINSGSKKAFPNPPTSRDHSVPKAGPGTDLAPVGKGPVWVRGSTVEAAWALYANHAGGYSVTASARCLLMARRRPSRASRALR